MEKSLSKKSFFSSKNFPFFNYLLNREQKLALLLAIGLYVIIYIIIKATYGIPVVHPDTGSYVLSAQTNTFNGYRPIGYSWFISYFHSINSAFEAIFVWQFFLNALANLALIFTIKYFFKPKNWLFYTFAALLIFSPSVLYCTNYVMSDSIFNTLTIVYITSSLWLIHKPQTINVLLHLIVLFLVINVRYTALFYPIISSIILIVQARKKYLYAIIALLPIFLLIKIYSDIRAQTRELYGFHEFSGFSGWALANNVVSIIPYIDLQPEQFRDPELKFIHQVITSYPDTIYTPEQVRTTQFMWSQTYPGKRILAQFIRTKSFKYQKAWIYSGIKFKEYGKILIKEYPWLYTKHFLFPNFKQLFVGFDINLKETYEPNELNINYFNSESEDYTYPSPFFHKLNGIRKISTPILWILFIIGLTYLFWKRKNNTSEENKALIFILSFFILFTGFSVVAHPINNFRYLIPVYFVLCLIPIIALNKAVNKENTLALK